MSYCELPEFFTDAYPKARKDHVCCECRTPIFKGERHGAFTGKWPGTGIKTYRQHGECESACVFIRDAFQSGECIGFGDLFEHAHEYSTVRDWNWKRIPRERQSENLKSFRSIMAQVEWRRHKQRKLNWLKASAQ